MLSQLTMQISHLFKHTNYKADRLFFKEVPGLGDEDKAGAEFIKISVSEH
jgi:hypothetical protein